LMLFDITSQQFYFPKKNEAPGVTSHKVVSTLGPSFSHLSALGWNVISLWVSNRVDFSKAFSGRRQECRQSDARWW